MVEPKHALIIGGGIGGLTAAIALHHAGVHATVFEARRDATSSGGGLQVASNGGRVLAALGVGDTIARSGECAEWIEFRNQAGRRLARVPNGRADKFGAPTRMLRRSALHRVLLDEVERLGIDLVYGKRLESITDVDARPRAIFDDGDRAEGDFIVGADGAGSVARTVVAPGSGTPFYTEMVSVGGFVDAAVLDPAEREALVNVQRMTQGLSGFFGEALVRGEGNGGVEREAVLWWSTFHSPGLPPRTSPETWTAQWKDRLLALHGGWHAPIPMLIRHTMSGGAWPIFDLPALPTWSRGRVVLLGDAAHLMLPHSGQGASQAIEDAWLLASLVRRDAAADLTTVFQAYEALRRPRVERIVAEARKRGEQKKPIPPVGAWIRDRVISLLMPVAAPRIERATLGYHVERE